MYGMMWYTYQRYGAAVHVARGLSYSVFPLSWTTVVAGNPVPSGSSGVKRLGAKLWEHLQAAANQIARGSLAFDEMYICPPDESDKNQH